MQGFSLVGVIEAALGSEWVGMEGRKKFHCERSEGDSSSFFSNEMFEECCSF